MPATVPAVALRPNDMNLDGILASPRPIPGRNWLNWAGPAVSLLILAAVAYQLRTIDYRELLALLPSSPLFWMVFCAYYLAGPASEWVIFRRLWSLPAGGFPALLRKLVSNEILLGYLGEVYFYAWARRHCRMTTAPFGAIKDVTILSAIVGNILTLALTVVAAPLIGSIDLGTSGTTFIGSAIFLLVSSMAVMVFRRRLFSLPRSELWFVAAVHAARIVASMLLAAIMWHLLLPAVALTWWLLLGTLRQLLSRLPLIPNKDLVFAGLAAMLVGQDVQIVAAMTLMASLILAAHVFVGAVLGVSELIQDSAA
jgi:hypothetical protein